MEAASPFPAPAAGALPSSAPILPPSPPRPAPMFERRDVDVTLVRPAAPRGRSRRAYRLTAVFFVGFAVGGWFALAQYIYG